MSEQVGIVGQAVDTVKHIANHLTGQHHAPAGDAPKHHQNGLGAVNDEIVRALGDSKVLPNPDPAHGDNSGIINAVANHAVSILAVERFGDEGSKKTAEQTLRTLTSTINDRREEKGLAAVSKADIEKLVVYGVEKGEREITAQNKKEVLEKYTGGNSVQGAVMGRA